MQRSAFSYARWDEQNALLVESHERVIAELTEEYEVRLGFRDCFSDTRFPWHYRNIPRAEAAASRFDWENDDMIGGSI